MAADIIPTRRIQIEMAAGEGQLEVLHTLLEKGFAQEDLDVALENAIAYSQMDFPAPGTGAI